MTRSNVIPVGPLANPATENELVRLRRENRELKQHIIALTEMALRRAVQKTEH